MTKVYDGMRVRLTEDKDTWIADLRYVEKVARIDESKIPQHYYDLRMFTKIDNARAFLAGYAKDKAGWPVIPAGSMGYIRKLSVFTIKHKREHTTSVLGVRSNYWFEDIVVPFGEDIDADVLNRTDWWALELDNFDLSKLPKEFRGIKCIGMVGKGAVGIYDEDCDLPDYLEEVV